MATVQGRAFEQENNHEVGNLNSLKVKTVAHGAICTEDIDNFTAVELGFNAEGERTASSLTAVGNKTYLIAAPETRYMNEAPVDFFNGVDERARIVVFEEAYTRFDTSAFELNDDGTANGGTAISSIQNGQVAHFNPATKKFMISDAASPATDYTNASAKFRVVSNEEDLDYTLGKATVRLEVIEA